MLALRHFSHESFSAISVYHDLVLEGEEGVAFHTTPLHHVHP